MVNNHLIERKLKRRAQKRREKEEEEKKIKSSSNVLESGVACTDIYIYIASKIKWKINHINSSSAENTDLDFLFAVLIMGACWMWALYSDAFHSKLTWTVIAQSQIDCGW